MAELAKNIVSKVATEFVAMPNVIDFSIVLGPNQQMIFSRSLEIGPGASIDLGTGAIVEVL